MSVDASETVVRRYLEEVWGRGKLELLSELVDPGVIDHDPMPSMAPGRVGWYEWVEGVRAAIPSLHITIQSLRVEGDLVYVRWLGQGLHLSRLGHLPPSKKEVYMTGVEIYRVRDGRIVERRGDLDLSDIIHASERGRGAAGQR